jgi:hypothetical protein
MTRNIFPKPVPKILWDETLKSNVKFHFEVLMAGKTLSLLGKDKKEITVEMKGDQMLFHLPDGTEEMVATQIGLGILGERLNDELLTKLSSPVITE